MLTYKSQFEFNIKSQGEGSLEPVRLHTQAIIEQNEGLVSI